MRRAVALCALLWGASATACDMPDEGTAPLHRAVTRVKYLAETEALVRSSQAGVQFVLSLDAPVRVAGRCYWPLEVRVDGQAWNGFLVSPDGKRVLVRREHGAPQTLAAWRRSRAAERFTTHR